ncbi:hypothetical protein D7D52_35970 [Nocardia yunnanensis]|uniref:Uncharacterized protein n=1 Tax=Nocardia yunnanensis TaxID=2382165 RepID=A0A386ZL46_9NOCA|nr:hypothetical protein [Nocardia yunnanensis]AYF78337.1 hypothetical protein D7D52_35970 [Nocardia yunnanensis]
MRIVDSWDIVAAADWRRSWVSFCKNEEHRLTAREMDRALWATNCEWRKRTLLGNDCEDQEWRIRYLRDARASLN